MPDAPVAAETFRQHVCRLQRFVRKNKRLPGQDSIGEERRSASFLNVQQQWWGGPRQGNNTERGPYPSERKRALENVPEMKKRVLCWKKLAAKNAQTAKVNVKRLTCSARRKLIDSQIVRELQVLQQLSHKLGRLPSRDDAAWGRGDRRTALVDTFARSPGAYSPAVRKLLKQVRGFSEYAAKLSANKRSKKQSQSPSGPLSNKLRNLLNDALHLLRATMFKPQARYNVSANDQVESLPPGVSFGMNLSLGQGYSINKISWKLTKKLSGLCVCLRAQQNQTSHLQASK